MNGIPTSLAIPAVEVNGNIITNSQEIANIIAINLRDKTSNNSNAASHEPDCCNLPNQNTVRYGRDAINQSFSKFEFDNALMPPDQMTFLLFF
ncbi:hypothetical protein HHI36_017822 [Cryptolaemus montrouzieri]|uniref:Uncharacterized protein n=1 Tax=Cryptolaemus montrouzieri TaxID=559131 RepID=A0ABD2NNR7_9CUCU